MDAEESIACDTLSRSPGFAGIFAPLDSSSLEESCPSSAYPSNDPFALTISSRKFVNV
jgi:hypothetical protein